METSLDIDHRKKVEKTWCPRPSDVKKKWWLVDATGKTLGRLATEIAKILRGKHRGFFTPYVDTGDFVIVLNCKKIHLSGNKMKQKTYYRHSRFFGSLKEITAHDLLKKKPEELIRFAVKGMLPRNKLAEKQIKKLKIYPEASHPHEAQKPSLLSLPLKKREKSKEPTSKEL